MLMFIGCSGPPSVAQLAGSWEAVVTEGSPQPRAENAFVELDGLMYLIGGGPDRIDIYDPETNTWTTGAAVPEPVHHFQAVAYDGKIYVVGAWIGSYPRQDGITNVLIYDPAEDAWTTGPVIPEARRRGSAGAVVYDDQIYVVGGNVGGHGPHATAVGWLDRFDPQTGEWEEMPTAARRRDHFQAALIDGRIYAAAGRTSDIEGYIDSTVSAVDVFDIESETWSTVSGAPIPTERAGTPTAAVGEYVIVTGGEGFGAAWAETEALNTETGQWELIGMLNQERHGTQMFYYDGRLWIAGGAAAQAGGRRLVELEVFTFDD
jgi:N-acetylneuraminic acid mutarotase